MKPETETIFRRRVFKSFSDVRVNLHADWLQLSSHYYYSLMLKWKKYLLDFVMLTDVEKMCVEVISNTATTLHLMLTGC